MMLWSSVSILNTPEILLFEMCSWRQEVLPLTCSGNIFLVYFTHFYFENFNCVYLCVCVLQGKSYILCFKSTAFLSPGVKVDGT